MIFFEGAVSCKCRLIVQARLSRFQSEHIVGTFISSRKPGTNIATTEAGFAVKGFLLVSVTALLGGTHKHLLTPDQYSLASFVNHPLKTRGEGFLGVLFWESKTSKLLKC